MALVNPRRNHMSNLGKENATTGDQPMGFTNAACFVVHSFRMVWQRSLFPQVERIHLPKHHSMDCIAVATLRVKSRVAGMEPNIGSSSKKKSVRDRFRAWGVCPPIVGDYSCEDGLRGWEKKISKERHESLIPRVFDIYIYMYKVRDRNILSSGVSNGIGMKIFFIADRDVKP